MSRRATQGCLSSDGMDHTLSTLLHPGWLPATLLLAVAFAVAFTQGLVREDIGIGLRCRITSLFTDANITNPDAWVAEDAYSKARVAARESGTIPPFSWWAVSVHCPTCFPFWANCWTQAATTAHAVAVFESFWLLAAWPPLVALGWLVSLLWLDRWLD